VGDGNKRVPTRWNLRNEETMSGKTVVARGDRKATEVWGKRIETDRMEGKVGGEKRE